MSAVRLLFWSAVVYALLLVLVRGVLPSESAPAISLTGIPLIVIVVMIARDLTRKSTSPTVRRAITTTVGFRGNPVQFLSGQFRVAANASNSYFENVVRARLRELLTTKVALEIGVENETVRRILLDPRDGPRLLEDETLYRMLYGPTPQGWLARLNLIGDAIDLIGAWKG
ncbi:hypothetical protein E6H17_06950 [Candidatus Bathyarchaeota archaeon]|nr:MAG: hypothetical protein E6H17_06950 [Candidatus Bathyarchaeota archaeon]